MNMPGFCAEVSLYPPPCRYRLTGDSSRLQSGKAIIPQARILDGFCIGNGSYCCFRGPDGKWSCGRTIST